MNTGSSHLGLSLLASLLVSACSSHIPPVISQSPDPSFSIEQVQANPDKHLNKTIRWGGVILKTDNKQDASYLTVIAFPLESSGRVNTSAQTNGRFIAKFTDFMEPEIYSQNREITLYGQVSSFETIKIGEYPYLYPVIEVTEHFLWPVRKDNPDYDYPPYWYDPWYHPFYPRYYPYHPHRH